MAKVRVFGGAWIKRVQKSPLAAVDLNPVENWIADVDVALIVDRQSGAMIRIREVDGPAEMEGCIENLNAIVADVEYEEFTTTNNCLARQSELAGPVTTAALTGLADEAPSVVHDNDHVAISIADVNASCCCVDGDSRWTLKVRFSSAQLSEGAETFRLRRKRVWFG